MRQACELALHLSTAREPARGREIAFHWPTRSSAIYDAEELADLKETSQEIAYMISEGCHVPDGWANAHLARHLDFLVGRGFAFEALLHHLDDKMEKRGYAKPYQLAAHLTQTWYECASEI